MSDNNSQNPQPPSPLTMLDPACIKRLMEAGVIWFERNHEAINKLNVFPVPDGDTGTNMLLTLQAAYRRLAERKSEGLNDRMRALADGAINGSRGNSGTLLSQMFDGFARTLQSRPHLDARALADAWGEAVKMAYKAVQTPVEGTILTVAREIAEEASEAATDTKDLRTILSRLVERGRDAVQRTPEQLPILKAAGVVDSGGRGLVTFLEGMLQFANGEVLTLGDPGATTTPVAEAHGSANVGQSSLRKTLTAADERGYGYDVQFVVHGRQLNIDQIRADIGAMGDSMVVVGSEEVVKVHIHVHDPSVPLGYGIKLGALTEIVVENMQDQFETYVEEREHTKELVDPEVIVNPDDSAVIAVAPGVGLRHILKQLGAAGIVMGGQTMNPSVEDFMTAMEALPTNKFILLPNNKNVVLTANQVARMAGERQLQVQVVPTTTVPQGIGAMLSFNPTGDLEEVTNDMLDASKRVTTGEVTRATRSVEINGVAVKEGQYIGLVNGKLVLALDDLELLIVELLEKMHARAHEVTTLYYGADVSVTEAQQMLALLQEHYGDGDLNLELAYGGQPHYPYLISVE